VGEAKPFDISKRDVWDAFKSYARKLVTAISGGVFDLLYPVLERDSVDDLGELV